MNLGLINITPQRRQSIRLTSFAQLPTAIVLTGCVTRRGFIPHRLSGVPQPLESKKRGFCRVPHSTRFSLSAAALLKLCLCRF